MTHQLDIFADSRDVALRNDLAQALLRGHLAAAQEVHDTLQAGFGGDPVLAPAAVLIEHLRARQALAADVLWDAATLRDWRQRLDDTVTPAAGAVLGDHDAAPWRAAQWRWLAGRAAGVAWHPDHAPVHAAALCLLAGAWAEAAEAVARIDAWRRIPQPLLWMTQARWRHQGADAAWPLLAEALWLAPARAAALRPALADKGLDRLVQRFEDQVDTTDPAAWAWLPAFALVDRPLLAAPLAGASPPPDSAAGQGFGTVMALLRLERQGRQAEIGAQRARLRGLSPEIFAAYMATR